MFLPTTLWNVELGPLTPRTISVELNPMAENTESSRLAIGHAQLIQSFIHDVYDLTAT